MSLEVKIEELTKAVEALTLVMSKGSAQVAEKAKTEVVEEQLEIVEQALNHDDLKAKCLEVARKGKKAEVKGVLASYDAVKAVDVPVAKIAEVIEKLGAL